MHSTRTLRVGAALTVSLCACLLLTPAATLRAQETVPFAVFRLEHAEPSKARATLRPLLGELAEQTEMVADPENGTLLIRGPAESLALARQFLAQFDRPPQPAPRAPRTVKGYDTGRLEPQSVAQQLQSRFDGHAKFVGDADGRRVLVVADDDTHRVVEAAVQELIRGKLNGSWETPVPAESVEPTSRPLAAPEMPDRQQPPPNVPQGTARPLPLPESPETAQGSPFFQTPVSVRRQAVHTFEVRRANSIRAAITQLLGDRLQRLPTGTYLLSIDDRELQLRFDEETNSCRIQGDPTLLAQIESLFQNLDRRSEPDGRTIRFIPLQKTDPAVLREAIRKWGQSQRPVIDRQQSATEPAGSFRIQLAGYASDEESSQANGSDRESAPIQPADAPTAEGEQFKRPVSDVELETLPDLDVVIIRGRDPDVEELTRIIREIERLSEQARPKIDIYQLKHARGEAVAEIVDQVQESLTGTLQGRVSITPLIKPDALLIIGWGEAVDAVMELLQRLDHDVKPETQMRVFRLRYAPAQQVQTTIEDFFESRDGLGPEVKVTLDRRTNSLIVHAAPRDLKELELLIAKLDVRGGESKNQARIIRLKNSLAEDLAATLQAAIAAAVNGGTNGRSAVLELLMVDPAGRKVVASGMLDEVEIVADSRTNSLIISGPPESLPLLESLIERFDESPASTAQLKVFQLRNADASDIVVVLRSMFPEQAVPSPVPNLARSTEESSIAPIRFSVDVRTNTVLATGPAGDLEIIEALLARLDQDGAQERETTVYRLKNSPAIDVAQAVNQFLQSERIVQRAAPGQQNPFQQIETEVVVVPEVVTNTLIISATPRYFDEIRELVEKLDEQPPQVLIQVVLAEVELNNIHEFGVELGLQDSLLFDRSLLGDLVTTISSDSLQTPNGIQTTTQEIIQAASILPGFAFNGPPLGNSGSDRALSTRGTIGSQAVSNFAVGHQNDELEYGGLVVSASSDSVSVLIRALDEHRHIEILSRPQVMTLDNQPAFIQVGQRVPRITGSSINQVGQVNQIELENVGLILGVTPRISPEGIVVMEVDAEKSELGAEEEGIPVSVSTEGTVIRSPRINVAVAQTTVSAASGQTIVIGGLITNRDRNVARRVPWLSDIPIVGEVFRYDSILNRRTELLIILTPHVIRSTAEAEHFKQLEMGRMSWCTSDVFEFTSTMDQMPYLPGTVDETGIPVIYPDITPGLEWKTPPAPGIDEETVEPGRLQDGSVAPMKWEGTQAYQSRGEDPAATSPERSAAGAADSEGTGVARLSGRESVSGSDGPPDEPPRSRQPRSRIPRLFNWGGRKQ